MEGILKSGEVLDDLQLNNLRIIQNRKEYCFTSDSVLLSNFAKVGHRDFVVEFCSGSGIISILINEKYKPKNIIGIELQEYLCDMSNRTLQLNNINNIKFLNENVINAKKLIGSEGCDVVVCNPPYFIPKENEIINPKYLKTKFETTIKLEDIFCSASKILKYSGKLYMEHIPDRLQEILDVAYKYNFKCKQMQFVYPQSNRQTSRLVLLMFTKGGNYGLNVLKPLEA